MRITYLLVSKSIKKKKCYKLILVLDFCFFFFIKSKKIYHFFSKKNKIILYITITLARVTDWSM